jgi:NAD(P)H dehydrogenase (quinone)
VVKILWVSAHPEPRSLNGALRADGLRTLAEAGHAYRESDLYAMRFDPVVRGSD